MSEKASEQQSATQTKKIIAIDDEAPIRFLIRHSLRNENYEIVEAGNGKEGLDTIRRESPDLIVMDVMMPEMNGLDTLQAIRADAAISHIPVLLLTGIKDKTKIQSALQHARTDYLAKPFLVEVLKERVRKLIDGSESSSA